MLSGVATLDGATSVRTNFTATTGPHGAPSCDTAGARGNAPATFRRFVVSTGSSGLLYGGPSVLGYHGPGTYRGTAVRMDDVSMLVHRVAVDFRRAPQSRVVVRVRADASGDASFTGFRAADGRVLNGRIRWSCTTRTQL